MYFKWAFKKCEWFSI